MNLILRVLRRFFWKACKILPIKKNKIAFVSFYGRPYADNPKYIAKEILNQKLDYDLVWLVNDDDLSCVPDGIRCVKLRSFSGIFEISTAKIWVDNSRKEYCEKKKNQFYIQTWHGGFGLKKIEKDAEDKLPDEYLRMAKRDASFCDVMVSNSKTLTKLYHDAFWFDGPVIEQGLPRNDLLLNAPSDLADSIKEKLNIDKERKLLLYAPTFRKNHDFSVYNVDFDRLADTLQKKFGGEWLILTKLHPNVIKEAKHLNLDSSCVLNVSAYNDIQELYAISDFCITDYSSVMFDFMLTKKPCVLYASDVEEYKKERDFFIQLNELPFEISETNDDLQSLILNFDNEKYLSEIQKFYDRLGFCETGNASKAVVELIKEQIGGTK